MRYQKFGNTDLQASVLGLGSAPIGSRTGKQESIKTLNLALDLGINFYDTAPSYGQGSSEEILGEVFKSRRDQVIITTKVGHAVSPTLQFAAKFKPMVRSALQQLPGMRKSVKSFVQSQTKTDNFEPSYILKSVEGSLKRLKSDYIDLLLLHSPPQEVLERGEVFTQLQSLKQQGKIRHYGVSAGKLAKAITCLEYPDTGICALQVTLNLFEKQALEEVIPLAEKQGVAIIAREPFAHGKLIPATNSSSSLSYQGDLAPDDSFAFLTADSTKTMTQAALQFSLQSEGVAVVLAGMSQARHVRDNVAALSLPELTPEQMQAIRAAKVQL